MATKNAISNKSGSLTLDAASSDPFVQISINSDDKFIFGADDSDSDKFKIADANSLDTANLFVMTADGERTLPLNPAFLAYNSSTDSNVTGSGQFIQIVHDSEIFDLNSDYNTGTGTFTASVSGRYFFIQSCSMSGLTAGQDNVNLRVSTSKQEFTTWPGDWGVISNASGELIINQVCFADMDAADTAICKLFVNGASQTVDFVGGASSTLQSYFAGYLVC